MIVRCCNNPNCNGTIPGEITQYNKEIYATPITRMLINTKMAIYEKQANQWRHRADEFYIIVSYMTIPSGVGSRFRHLRTRTLR